MTHKVYLATPLRGAHIHMATAATIINFCRDPNLILAQTEKSLNEDVSRTRSRIAHQFLKTDATHLFFLDADVSCPPATIHALLAAERPIVAAPYPKKHTRKWPKVDPTWYPTGEMEGPFQPALVPMGCTLIERSVIERMTAAHPELAFGEVVSGEMVPALFMLHLGPNPWHPEHPSNMWPEDFSFCLRAHALGIPSVVHMGTKAYHWEGSVCFPEEERS